MANQSARTISIILEYDIDTFIYEDINGTPTACGGEKNSVISPTTILPLLLLYIASVTTLKGTLAICIFFFNLELCFKLRLFTRDNSWF